MNQSRINQQINESIKQAMHRWTTYIHPSSHAFITTKYSKFI